MNINDLIFLINLANPNISSFGKFKETVKNRIEHSKNSQLHIENMKKLVEHSSTIKEIGEKLLAYLTANNINLN